MQIHLMRHYKVDFKWKKKYNSFEFDKACRDYNSGSIQDDKTVINIEYDIVYTSTLKRSLDTLRLLKINKETIKSNLLNEIPFKSFVNTSLFLPTFIWFGMGYFQWFFNCSRQKEGRFETMTRINEIIGNIEAKGLKCLIIGHGFYTWEMRRVLRNKNFIGGNNGFYKNGQVDTFTKQLNR